MASFSALQFASFIMLIQSIHYGNSITSEFPTCTSLQKWNEIFMQHQQMECGFLTPSIFPFIPPYLNFFYYSSARSTKSWLYSNKRCNSCRKYLKSVTWMLNEAEPNELISIFELRGLNVVQFNPELEVKSQSNWFGFSRIINKCLLPFQSNKTSNSIQEGHPAVTQRYQKFNMIPGEEILDDKVSQTLQMRLLEKILKGEPHAISFPTMFETFLLPKEYNEFLKKWTVGQGPQNIWIIKPRRSSNSRGIKMIANPKQIPWSNVTAAPNSYVIQKYMTEPFLADNRKSEFRVYVVIMSIHPAIRAYITTSRNQYRVKHTPKNFTLNLDSLNDSCIHTRDTNCGGIGGSFNWAADFFKAYLGNDRSKIRKIETQIEEIIRAYLLTIQRDKEWLRKVEASLFNNYNAYHRFAFDFLMDNKEHVFLNEINHTPKQDYVHYGSNYVNKHNLAGFHLPPNLNQKQFHWLQTCLNTDNPNEFLFNEKLYELEISEEDKQKEALVIANVRSCFPCSESNWNDIMTETLGTLSASDIKFLMLCYDEAARTSLKRILPVDPWTTRAHKNIYKRLNYYSAFLVKNMKETKYNAIYYYLLHEAWVWKYETKVRIVKELTKLALKKFHLK